MHTMVVNNYRNRTKWHLAGDDYVSFCGLTDLLVRDNVVMIDGEVRPTGEGGQVFKAIPKYEICKKCLSSHKLPAAR